MNAMSVMIGGFIFGVVSLCALGWLAIRCAEEDDV
jgi:hypothetical protein